MPRDSGKNRQKQALLEVLERCGISSRGQIDFRYRRFCESTRPAVNAAIQDLIGRLRKVFPQDDPLTDLEIALREALANAAFHGNRSSPSKSVFLRCYGVPSCGVLVVIRDQGPGFDPAEVPDPTGEDRLLLPHGRGIFLMRRLLDGIDYRRGGAEVILLKTC